MIAYLLYHIVFAFGTGCFIARVIWPSMQQDQIFYGWTLLLEKWDRQGHTNVVKFLGLCELCFSHFCSVLSFIVFVVFSNYMLGGFPPFNADYIALKVLFTLLCWSLYAGISVTTAMWQFRSSNTNN